MNFRVGINQIGDGPDIQTENRFRISLGYQKTKAGYPVSDLIFGQISGMQPIIKFGVWLLPII